jgi:DNA-binding NtrC family response regulator
VKGTILIIDDDPDILGALSVLLEDEFARVQTESNTNRISALVSSGNFDAILLDMNFSAGINSGNEGLFWLSKIREANPRASVILMTAYGNISLAVEGIKRGAKDFILKPWDNEKLIATLRATLTQAKPSEQRVDRSTSVFIKGQSRVMEKLYEQIKKVAATDASVLLLGENGTGKEVAARELHRLSARANEIFLSVDMSTLTPALFESEMFGHKKGAFTDARTDRQGRFESAQRGTLFLDEIGNLPLPQQMKLLAVLQNREVTPLGSNESIPVDVRLISATNTPLPLLSQQGLFRQDLLFRINTVTLTIPPLRDRENDVLLLASHFLDRYRKQYKRGNVEFNDEAKQSLLSYSWPGNVRELQHTIEKAVILSEGEWITSVDLNLSISAKPVLPTSLKTLEDLEKDALERALVNHGGNIVQAAKTLGITRQTLYNKMKKYGL